MQGQGRVPHCSCSCRMLQLPPTPPPGLPDQGQSYRFCRAHCPRASRPRFPRRFPSPVHAGALTTAHQNSRGVCPWTSPPPHTHAANYISTARVASWALQPFHWTVPPVSGWSLQRAQWDLFESGQEHYTAGSLSPVDVLGAAARSRSNKAGAFPGVLYE